jgi:hypothetical protein
MIVRTNDRPSKSLRIIRAMLHGNALTRTASTLHLVNLTKSNLRAKRLGILF